MNIEYLSGVYEVEKEGERIFRWLQPEAEIRITELAGDENFLEIELFSPTKGVLSLSGDKGNKLINLLPGWQVRYIRIIDFSTRGGGRLRAKNKYRCSSRCTGG